MGKANTAIRAILTTIVLTGIANFSSDALAEEGKTDKQSDPIVTVLGKPITLKQLDNSDDPQRRASYLCQLVYAYLQPHYAEAKGISPTDEEIKPMMARYLKNAKTNGHNITQEKIDQIVAARPEMSKLFPAGMILEWKTCKSLWEKHGGNVGLGSLGMWLPLQGRLALLKEYHAAGDLKFHDEQIEKQFWIAANDVTDKRHFADTVLTNKERIAEYFSKPPWMESDQDQ